MRVGYSNNTSRRVLASKREDGRECMWGFCNMIEFIKDNETVRCASIRME